MQRTIAPLPFAFILTWGTVTAAPSTSHLPPPMPMSTPVAMAGAQGTNSGIGVGQLDNSTCTVAGDPAAKVVIRCDTDPLHILAETAITVDPNDPNHLLMGANEARYTFSGRSFKFQQAV